MEILIPREVIDNAIVDACRDTEARYLKNSPEKIGAADQAIASAKSQMLTDAQMEADSAKLNALL